MTTRDSGDERDRTLSETSSQLLFRDTEYGRAAPIPLDIIASELKKQSELLEDIKSNNDNSANGLSRFLAPANPHRDQPATSDEAATAGPPPSAGSSAKADPENTHSMGDYTDTPNLAEPGRGATTPRKSSDVLTDRLMEIRRRAEKAERESAEMAQANRALQEQLSDLRANPEQTDDGDAEARIEALHQELDKVRAKAREETQAMRQLLHEADAADQGRDVELEAELQAVRQEAAVLRHATQEKDKILEELATQCRGLEDILEDRDREMDKLFQELELIRHGGPSTPSDDLSDTPEAKDDLSAFIQDSDSGTASAEVLDDDHLIYLPESGNSWRVPLLSGVAGLALCLLLLETASFSLGNGELFSHLIRNDAPSLDVPPAPEPADTPPATRAPPAIVESKTAKPLSPRTEPPRALDSEARVAPSLPKRSADTLRIGGTGPGLIHLDGGSFVMGSKGGTNPRSEQPAHEVRIKPLGIGSKEITFAQYDRFAQATRRPLPDDEGWGRGERPVINVSWNDAQAYAEWLSKQTGRRYRLPSEAEWEFAARGGTTTHYWWGFRAEPGRAVCFDCGSEWDKRSTAPTGSLGANPYGLHDTAGNVMEWIQDCYNPTYQGAPNDGSAWSEGDCSQRMVRGGAFRKPASSMRSAARSQLPQDARFNMLGFRVVREDR